MPVNPTNPGEGQGRTRPASKLGGTRWRAWEGPTSPGPNGLHFIQPKEFGHLTIAQGVPVQATMAKRRTKPSFPTASRRISASNRKGWLREPDGTPLDSRGEVQIVPDCSQIVTINHIRDQNPLQTSFNESRTVCN